ncbi:MAG: SMI1/KNR4 family protein [Minicystis sp.]
MRWQSLLYEIRGLKLDLARLDPRAGMPVLPPTGAAPAAIDAVERRLGCPLPPSYREMLAQHDGVPQLYQGASLLGTRPLTRGTYVDLARMVIDVPGVGAASASDLVPFGIDATGEAIFAWDRARVHEDGEIEVVVWVNENRRAGGELPCVPRARARDALRRDRRPPPGRAPRVAPPRADRRALAAIRGGLIIIRDPGSRKSPRRGGFLHHDRGGPRWPT